MEATMEQRKKPWWAWGCQYEMTGEERRLMRNLNAWMIAWAVLHTVALVLLKRHSQLLGGAAYAVAAVPVVAGCMAVYTYGRFLRAADELHRKIQYEGIALGFAAGVVFAITYPLLERLGAPELGSMAPLPVMIAMWGVGVWTASRRYS